jgi:hypothetical protein
MKKGVLIASAATAVLAGAAVAVDLVRRWDPRGSGKSSASQKSVDLPRIIHGAERVPVTRSPIELRQRGQQWLNIVSPWFDRIDIPDFFLLLEAEVDETVLTMINKDVARTMPHHPLFSGGEDSEGQNTLRRILRAYAAAVCGTFYLFFLFSSFRIQQLDMFKG